MLFPPNAQLLCTSMPIYIACHKHCAILTDIPSGNWRIPSMSRGQKFTEGDAFIGYQRDTPAAVVFQATHQLRERRPVIPSIESERMEQGSVPGLKVEEEELSDMWKENVSFSIVLQTCMYGT